MIYRGGKNKTLTLIDRDTGSAFVNFIITGDDKFCTEVVDGNETFHTFYERLDRAPDDDELRIDDGRSIFEGTWLARDDSWFEDSEKTDLVTGSYYYLDGDTDSDNIYFYNDNAVDFNTVGGDTVRGSWSVDGVTLTITWYEFDTTVEMTIKDGGETLVDGQGDCYKLD